jgi:hypothetical protein
MRATDSSVGSHFRVVARKLEEERAISLSLNLCAPTQARSQSVGREWRLVQRFTGSGEKGRNARFILLESLDNRRPGSDTLIGE